VDSKREKSNIMFVYAHITDCACEGTGTAIIHADLGDTVTAVMCTDGERHHADIFLEGDESPGRRQRVRFVRANMEQMKSLKRREGERVGAIIGLREIIYLGWPDEYPLSVTRDRVVEMAEVIQRVKPDVIVTHIPVGTTRPEDQHKRIGMLVLQATKHAENRIRQADGVAPFTVKEIFYIPMGGEMPDARDMLAPDIVCDVWIDITPVIERKVQAIDQIVSQSYQGQRARKAMEARDGWRGMLAGVSYAECFVRSQGVTYSSLPMPESRMKKKYVASGLAEYEMKAYNVPLATPHDAFELPRLSSCGRVWLHAAASLTGSPRRTHE
jgi:LmbE family N-acetylglucosaminyl deacetylase